MQGFKGKPATKTFNEDPTSFRIALMNWPIPLFVVGLSDHFRDAPRMLDDEKCL